MMFSELFRAVNLSLPDFTRGSVWLVGAGPGEPGLLTLLAVHALCTADVIVHDALVEPLVLALARPKSEQYNMGKRGGCPSPRQEAVTALLVDLARSGRRVLRLKGGDPLMFGRGLEEIKGLSAAGIPIHIVPGLTAGIAGPAVAGLAITGRSDSAVTFLTGTGPDGTVPSINWNAVAMGAPTLVLYMALRRLDEIVCRLLAAGRPATEPVAIVCSATTSRQKTLFSSLGQVASTAAVLQPPAIVVIGSGAALANNFRGGTQCLL